MKPSAKFAVFLTLALTGVLLCAQRSVMYDPATYYINLPTNVLGWKFGNQLITNLVGTDLVNSGGSLGVGAAVARDSEVAAGYQPLDSDLTALAGGTVMATAITNGASIGSPTLYVGTTNVAEALEAKQPLDSDLTTVANLTGGTSTNFFAGDGSFKQVTTNMIPGLNSILGSITGGSFDLLDDFANWETVQWPFFGGTGTLAIQPLLVFSAIASGVQTVVFGDSGGATVIRTAASTALNTGGSINSSTVSLYLAASSTNQLNFVFNVGTVTTNTAKLGFGDSITTTEHVDALCFVVTNEVVYGMALSNSVKTLTTATMSLTPDVNFDAFILQTNNSARFLVQSNGVALLDETLSGGLPIGSARFLGIDWVTWNGSTTETNSQDLLQINSAMFRHHK